MTTPTLTDRLSQAEHEAAGPRRRVAELQDALTRAVAVGEYEQAAVLKTDLAAAREEMVAADAAVASLRAGHVEAERAAASDTQTIEQARTRQHAEQELTAAREAEQQGLDAVSEALASMREALASAQRSLRAAQAAEMAVNTARRAEITAQGQLGLWPDGHPGPVPAKANQASVLVDRDPLVGALARWSRT